jgi:hypothetical protein
MAPSELTAARPQRGRCYQPTSGPATRAIPAAAAERTASTSAPVQRRLAAGEGARLCALTMASSGAEGTKLNTHNLVDRRRFNLPGLLVQQGNAPMGAAGPIRVQSRRLARRQDQPDASARTCTHSFARPRSASFDNRPASDRLARRRPHLAGRIPTACHSWQLGADSPLSLGSACETGRGSPPGHRQRGVSGRLRFPRPGSCSDGHYTGHMDERVARRRAAAPDPGDSHGRARYGDGAPPDPPACGQQQRRAEPTDSGNLTLGRRANTGTLSASVDCPRHETTLTVPKGRPVQQSVPPPLNARTNGLYVPRSENEQASASRAESALCG